MLGRVLQSIGASFSHSSWWASIGASKATPQFQLKEAWLVKTLACMDDTKASEKSLQGSENGRASATSLEEPTSDGANENSKELSCFRFFSEWRHCTCEY